MSILMTQPGVAGTPTGNHQPATICVVDDSATIRAIVRVSLESLGYRVTAFPDGSALWQWLVQQTTLPVLLLLDIELPTMDGYKLARSLREYPRYQGIPLVMLSSRDSVTDRLKGRVAGAQIYLTKPFAVQQLQEAVQTVLAPNNSRIAKTSETTRETH